MCAFVYTFYLLYSITTQILYVKVLIPHFKHTPVEVLSSKCDLS